MYTTTSRSYERAVTLLNSLQTNASHLEALKKSGNAMNQRSLAEMEHFVHRIGYKVPDLNKLNVIHVAGTKGKGSTSAICEAIARRLELRNASCQKRLKTGLFTSPHLIEVRERIRIDGKPIEKDLFTKYFFDVWEALENTKDVPRDPSYPSFPAYFRYLTLLSLHTFISENVDIVLFEVGMGGQYDSTNIISKPVVCGITSLGLDHIPLLGRSLEDIAWHKAGILKPGVPAFTVPQPPSAMAVIEQRAKELQASSLTLTPPLSHEKASQLSMSGAYQRVNASLAVALMEAWVEQMRKSGVEILSTEDAMREGLRTAAWPGRAQKYVAKQCPTVTWYLDGAHTGESMNVCVEWFQEELSKARQSGNEEEKQRWEDVTLIFTLTKARDISTLLSPLAVFHNNIHPFKKIIFTTQDPYTPGSEKWKNRTDQVNYTVDRKEVEKVLKQLKDEWEKLNNCDAASGGRTLPTDLVELCPSIDDAVQSAISSGSQTVLVTGSLYLIGGLLGVLEAEVV
ncbi:Folylpolyglutamate synthetase [Gaertneriomyces sp. JEL0708]|nr:Folylpolyglutamate synthetase [Gaertneriomyces sp. JEL0708]